jgi:hypothetical protein
LLSAAPAQTAPAQTKYVQPANGMLLSCPSESAGTTGSVACILTAQALGEKVTVCRGDAKSFLPSLNFGGTQVSGTGAICRFLAHKAKESGTKLSPEATVVVSSVSDLCVDELMEYLENELYPKLLSESKKRCVPANGDVPADKKKKQKGTPPSHHPPPLPHESCVLPMCPV